MIPPRPVKKKDFNNGRITAGWVLFAIAIISLFVVPVGFWEQTWSWGSGGNNYNENTTVFWPGVAIVAILWILSISFLAMGYSKRGREYRKYLESQSQMQLYGAPYSSQALNQPQRSIAPAYTPQSYQQPPVPNPIPTPPQQYTQPAYQQQYQQPTYQPQSITQQPSGSLSGSSQSSSGSNNCPRCGQLIGENWSTCPKCGGSLR